MKGLIHLGTPCRHIRNLHVRSTTRRYDPSLFNLFSDELLRSVNYVLTCLEAIQWFKVYSSGKSFSNPHGSTGLFKGSEPMSQSTFHLASTYVSDIHSGIISRIRLLICRSAPCTLSTVVTVMEIRAGTPLT